MTDQENNADADVTRLLHAYANGDEASLNAALPVIYAELKLLARSQLRRSGVKAQMQTTVLVHEAYEKLVLGQTQNPTNRQHFFAIASRAMRQIVVDAYRASQAAKRGGDNVLQTLATLDLVDSNDPEAVLQFDQALERLATESEPLAQVVELSCFGGFSTAEIAELNDTNVRTGQRQLTRARAWLGHFLETPEP